MIPIYQGEAAKSFLEALQTKSRYHEGDTALTQSVQSILEQVCKEGDTAISRLAIQFGDPLLENFTLTPQQVEAAVNRVPLETKQLLSLAAENIRTFAQAICQSLQPVTLNQPHFSAGLNWRPVERVACYVPAGRYPLPSTALMTAITAQVAGVPEIILVSPTLRDEIVFAGTLAGVQRFYQLGGAQAVAALAYGTQSILKADMVVGPGNAYVTEAKRQLQGVIGIDMLAGPSEVAIIADEAATPEWVVWDMLAQAEHDPDARSYLLTDSAYLAEKVASTLESIISKHENLPGWLTESANWGCILILPSLKACTEVANQLAPEHLELLVAHPEALKPTLNNYGALFLGYNTPVPVGDYMAGPNHTLPTNRSSRFSGTLNPLTFLRPQSWIQVIEKAQPLFTDTANFAGLEGLLAHQQSAQMRLS